MPDSVVNTLFEACLNEVHVREQPDLVARERFRRLSKILLPAKPNFADALSSRGTAEEAKPSTDAAVTGAKGEDGASRSRRRGRRGKKPAVVITTLNKESIEETPKATPTVVESEQEFKTVAPRPRSKSSNLRSPAVKRVRLSPEPRSTPMDQRREEEERRRQAYPESIRRKMGPLSQSGTPRASSKPSTAHNIDGTSYAFSQKASKLAASYRPLQKHVVSARGGRGQREIAPLDLATITVADAMEHISALSEALLALVDVPEVKAKVKAFPSFEAWQRFALEAAGKTTAKTGELVEAGYQTPPVEALLPTDGERTLASRRYSMGDKFVPLTRKIAEVTRRKEQLAVEAYKRSLPKGPTSAQAPMTPVVAEKRTTYSVALKGQPPTFAPGVSPPSPPAKQSLGPIRQKRVVPAAAGKPEDLPSTSGVGTPSRPQALSRRQLKRCWKGLAKDATKRSGPLTLSDAWTPGESWRDRAEESAVVAVPVDALMQLQQASTLLQDVVLSAQSTAEMPRDHRVADLFLTSRDMALAATGQPVLMSDDEEADVD